MTSSSSRTMLYEDVLSPCDVKLSLERDMKTLFKVTFENNKLRMRAKSTLVGAEYDFQIVFEAALPACNFYQLTMNVTWVDPTSKISSTTARPRTVGLNCGPISRFRNCRASCNHRGHETRHSLSDLSQGSWNAPNLEWQSICSYGPSTTRSRRGKIA